MYPDLTPGISGYQEKIVEPTDSASAFGSGMVDVYATPAMIALMEKTAMESVQPLLPEGYITVGTEMNVKHLQATGIGMKVACHSTLTYVEDRKLVFEIMALDARGEIGQGTHTRVIVEKERFLKKLG
jgi:fluoroacetyl-CoA thioesterase